MPAASVIIPAYNAAATIGETLRSLEQQRWRDFEVIVIDDGSTDETAAIVERDFPAVRLLRQANGGPAAARNAGAAQATGDWLAFLDADDAWLPWRLELQLELAAVHPAIQLWAGTVVILGKEAIPEQPTGHPPFQQLCLDDFAVHNQLATTTVLLRRDAFEAANGFDTAFRGPEDYDLWLRVVARGPVARITYPLALYRVTEGSLSQNDQRFLPQVLGVLRKAYAADGVLAGRDTHAQAVAWQYVSCSWMAYTRRARLRAAWLMLRSILRHPRALSVGRIANFGRLKLLLRYLLTPPPH